MTKMLAYPPGLPAAHATVTIVPPSAQALLEELLASSLVLAEDWELLPAEAREALVQCSDRRALLSLLCAHGLLNEYQAARVGAGTTHGLILGNYRVLDRLGVGGMGVVFRGEHRCMRRQVAIKVLSLAR
ncbi:MAG TPA: hypothetical protein VG013_43885, partial [Gemmataceae bacterium]|nr:hypothetical protein [Gemmataceae bacterium]